jgi:hypothetical protein
MNASVHSPDGKPVSLASNTAARRVGDQGAKVCKGAQSSTPVLTHLLRPGDERLSALCGHPELGPLDLNFCNGEITCPDCCEIRDACRAERIPLREHIERASRT